MDANAKPDEGTMHDAFRPRLYQIEMFEESLQRNIVVAMPTGSGKTLIAIMRARYALEHSPAEKLVWFCGPKVQLVRQQYEKMSVQLPSFKSKILSGADGCDFWTKSMWEKVLDGTRIIVSTYAILRDALAHAFVTLDRLCLLIYDEAHHATKKHAANGIMRDFYHTMPRSNRPDFLGLTATPVNRISNLAELEANLSAICRTPTSTRAALDNHVHVPNFVRLPYHASAEDLPTSASVESLACVLGHLNLEEDPWVIRMKSQPETASSYGLLKVERTYTRQHIKSLYIKAELVAIELGPWLADVYVHDCIHKFREANETTMSLFDDMGNDELLYLKSKLAIVHVPGPEQLRFTEGCHLSDKSRVLVQFLSTKDPSSLRCLIFAKTRAQVAMLTHLFLIHPSTCKFSSASFVGDANHPSRKRSLAELADVKQQQDALKNLQSGVVQIIVATEALEEGIDIVSCDTVICFDVPTNLRSFVQRRGRASRRAASTFAVLSKADDKADKSAEWNTLDNMMTEAFNDQEREVDDMDSDVDLDDSILENPNTGETLNISIHTGSCGLDANVKLARIYAADAVAHLQHFCGQLTRDRFVDPSPDFDYDVKEVSGKIVSYHCKVRLPNTLQAHLRSFEGSSWWKSEKAARRDCAFVTYKALFEADLLDEHLLARDYVDEIEKAALQSVEVRPSVVIVSGQISMWRDMARSACSDAGGFHALNITVHRDEEMLKMCALSHSPFPPIADFDLFWDSETMFSVRLELDPKRCAVTVDLGDKITNLVVSNASSGRSIPATGFLIKFVNSICPDECSAFDDAFRGTTRAHDWQLKRMEEVGVVRDMTRNGLPFIFRGYHSQTKEDFFGASDRELTDCTDESECRRLELAMSRISSYLKGENLLDQDSFVLFDVNKFPKQRDFLHRDSVPLHTPATETILADCCNIDNLPLEFARFGCFIPAIMHKIHVAFIVEHLCSSILLPIDDLDRGLVKTALSTRAAREDDNYERLEFLGDSILKFCTTFMLFTKNLTYPESILSRLKDHIVSNTNLGKAAIESGLDKFIITDAFTGAKWSPPCKDNFSGVVTTKQREMSTKTLADVVEALVGAAYQNGTYRQAIVCLKIFLPQQPWDIISSAFNILAEVYQERPQPVAVVETAEEVVKHKFKLKSLIAESVCHASHQEPGSWAPYERLEFLGDAILDNIVTIAAHKREPPLSVKRLHLIRTTMVNADFLGYLCLQYGIERMETTHVVHDLKSLELQERRGSIKLWQLLRYASPTIRVAIEACLRRFDDLESPIAEALRHDSQYPWTLLAELYPPKPLSDIVESILGAIFIDTSGSMPDCENFLERIGLRGYLRHVLESDSLNLWHPKEELGQLANQDVVQYKMSKQEEGGKTTLSCKVIVGERELAWVEGGRTPLGIQTRAADIARQILRDEKMDVESESETDDDGSNDDGAVPDDENGGVLLQEAYNANKADDGTSNGNVDDMDDDEYMTASE